MCNRSFFLTFSTALIVGVTFIYGCDKKDKALNNQKFDEVNAISTSKPSNAFPEKWPAPAAITCKNNPEGYLYFKDGDELFRVNKDSSLIIVGVRPDIDDKGNPIVDPSEIPKGCAENPFRGGIRLDKNFKKGRDDVLIEAERIGFRFGVSGVRPDRLNELTSKGFSIKNFRWEDRKNGYHVARYGGGFFEYICQDYAEGVAHCVFKEQGEKGLSSRVGYYVLNPALAKTAQDLPIIIDCMPSIETIECSALYRLYPSLNLEYSVHESHDGDINPEDFLKIDRGYRELFESIRVSR